MSHSYSDQDKAAIYKVIAERRDMRHFLPTPIAPDILQRLLEAAHHAPSVGLMQPWRFIRVSDTKVMKLKVEGILDCGELLVATLCDHREEHIFGRRTIPEMDLASVSCAIQNIWLAARAEGIGMGWVSFFDPPKLASLLNMPEGAKPIAILCLGYVNSFYKSPMLVEEGWKTEKPLSEMLMENTWQDKDK